MFESDKWFVVRRWLDLLPEDVRLRRPKLLLAQAWVDYYQFRIPGVAASVAQIETLIDDVATDPIDLAELRFFQTFLAYWNGDATTAEDCVEQAFAVLSTGGGIEAGEVTIYAALARHLAGNDAGALGVPQAKKSSAADAEHGELLTRLCGGEAFVHLLAARLSPVAVAARGLETAEKKIDSVFARAWAHYLQAIPCLHTLDLEGALQHFLLARMGRDLIERRAAVDVLAGTSLAYVLMLPTAPRTNSSNLPANSTNANTRPLPSPHRPD